MRKTISQQPKPKTPAKPKAQLKPETQPKPGTQSKAKPIPKPVPKPLVSFVIPTINQVDLVVKCLSSLGAGLSLPVHAFEYVVVDDGSPPPLQEKLAKALRPFNGRLLRWKKNTGFAHAVNSGAAVARGRYLCLVNNDLVFPRKPWLAAMLKEIEKPGAGVVGARLLYPSGRLQHAGIVYLPRARRFDHEYRHRPGNYPPALETTEVLGVTGALMLVEKGFWNKLGGMDEQFFLSWEDVDFSLRTWAAGRRVLYTGQAYAVHPEGSTRANRKAASWAFWHKMDRETKARFWRKWGGRFFTAGWPDPETGGKPRFSRLQADYWCKVLRG
ncbi:MAG TPA: glycosyltransferase family 2 protein [Firmicutes bacterium]|nr:glycosyltransferase family 2 protein [Bacillota bacterium]